ncbi:MAG: hypothetical protein AAGD22_08055 [Verrucomicrobiota bacterium]
MIGLAIAEEDQTKSVSWVVGEMCDSMGVKIDWPSSVDSTAQAAGDGIYIFHGVAPGYAEAMSLKNLLEKSLLLEDYEFRFFTPRIHGDQTASVSFRLIPTRPKL